jgi:hypothetical protein
VDLEVIEAGALSQGGELGIDLGPDGRPRRPLVALRPGTRRFTAPRIAVVKPIVVLVRDQPEPIDDDLVAFADLTLGVPGIDSPAVELMDPWAGARRLAEVAVSTPCASLTLAGVLRSAAYEQVDRGLVTESLAYSTLQSGAEFAHWRAAAAARGARSVEDRSSDAGPRVRVERIGDVLSIALTRPARRNALDARMRDELLEALGPALWDTRLRVELSGEGPTFCAGGDLDEFGTATDPAAAHLVRLANGLGPVMHELRDRLTVRVHGHCHGAGIELAAFAARVVADVGSRFTLPEVAMGLIPGAGGTTSIPRRIGPGRTLWLALSGAALDASTALEWGLIDAIG